MLLDQARINANKWYSSDLTQKKYYRLSNISGRNQESIANMTNNIFEDESKTALQQFWNGSTNKNKADLIEWFILVMMKIIYYGINLMTKY